MYTFTQPFQYPVSFAGQTLRVEFEGSAAVEAIEGVAIGADGGGSVDITVPNDWRGVITFVRESDERVLGRVAFDWREIPYLNAASGQMAEQVEYIYDLYHILPADRPPLPPLSDPAEPGMVMLGVALRNGPNPVVGVTVKLKMLEERLVAIDGAYEVKKEYTAITNASGIAQLPAFASTRLLALNYEGLYNLFVNEKFQRDVWIPENGGWLHQLPKVKP